MKIATWNVNSLRVRLAQVLDWLAANPVDVLAVQETKLVDEQFPAEAIREAGYHVIFSGQKTYNGVAILSRVEADDVLRGLPGNDDDPQRRFLAASIDGVRAINVYVPNGQDVASDKYVYKLDWLARLRDVVAAELLHHPRLVVLGDFNIAPADEDVHDPAAWEGKVLFSEPEKAALRALLDVGLADSFRLFKQPPATFSWWDYRAAGFRRNAGLRIDHILASQPMADACRACRVDIEPRRLERPSDHAPVVAEFDPQRLNER
jgi:exodeoxyribonuclease-3